MKRTLTALVLLTLAALPAHACACCYQVDPTGTPTNVRDKPNGKVIDTLPKNEIVSPVEVSGGKYVTQKDSRGHEWMLVEYGDDNAWKGWIFRRFLKCN